MSSSPSFSKLRDVTRRPLFYYILVFLLGIIPFFYNLGGPVLNHWDESRRAVNAYEMAHNGKLIVTYFDGEPEMWGTKPPLMIWMQALSFKVFGDSEFALRFPVALSGMLLALLLVWFSGIYFRDHLYGLISALVLYTTTAMISVHSARSGDFDLILILFTTAGIFFMLLACETEEKRKRDRFILLFFIAFTLAALTKGIAPFLLAPALLVYLLISRQLLTWLRSWNFWIGAAILVGLFGGYYLLREIMNPGYLQAVMENEMTGRYFETLEKNAAPFHYYIRGIYQWRFKNWFYLVPIAVFMGYLVKERRITRFLNLTLLVTLCYILIISASETKLEWYDLPVFPFLVMMAALFFHIIIRGFTGEHSPVKAEWGRRMIPLCLLFFFFFTPYYNVFKQVRSGESFKQDETYRLSHYLRNLHDGGTGEGGFNIIHEGENAQQFLFYTYLLEEDGTKINILEPGPVTPGVEYLIHQPAVMKKLQADHPHLQLSELSEGIFLVTLDDHLTGDDH